MTLEELKDKTKHEVIIELTSDLKEGKETELTNILKAYLETNYHLIKRDLKPEQTPNRDYLIGVILTETAKNFGVTPEEIAGKSRKHPLPDARHVYFYIARTYFKNMSTSFLANIINRDHSTAIHGTKKVAGYLQTDKLLAKRIDDILGNIKIKLGSLKNN